MKAEQMQTRGSEGVEIGGLQIGIILLALATAVVHLVILNISMGGLDLLFTLNGLGYLGLLALYFLPIPIARENRSPLRWVFLAFTAATIIAWILLNGQRSPLGFADKAIEVVLIVLLWMDRG
jgi:hypothetical protein